MKTIKRISIITTIFGASALIWLLFFKDLHLFRRDLSLEDRKNAYVGQTAPLSDPIVLRIPSKANQCAVIEKADIDGDTILIYWTWKCPSTETAYVSLHWALKTKNETIIAADYTYMAARVPLASGDRSEYEFKRMPKDPRMATLTLIIKSEAF